MKGFAEFLAPLSMSIVNKCLLFLWTLSCFRGALSGCSTLIEAFVGSLMTQRRLLSTLQRLHSFGAPKASLRACVCNMK